MKPTNVWYLGELSESERRIVMELAMVALNPLKTGSGTSIKMFDYMACGLPIISSAVGARGLNLADGIDYYACDPDDLAAFLNNFNPLAPSVDKIVKTARRHVETHGDWANITRTLISEQFALGDAGVAPPPFLAH
jgi:glycosyltransferase involved in cell wall biosynthesis